LSIENRFPEKTSGDDSTISQVPAASETVTHGLGQGNDDARSRDFSPGHDCARGELFFRQGHIIAALECARQAFSACPDDPEALATCAWLFSNGAAHGEAAAVYERMLAARPGWAEGHRHASGSFACAGEIDRAIAHGIRASDLAPGAFEPARHVGSLLLDAGRAEAAFAYLARATALAPEDGLAQRQLSAAAWELGRSGEAVRLALRAHALMPRDAASACHAAELLMRTGRSDEAAAIAQHQAGATPGDAAVLRQLSQAELLRDRPDAALGAIDRALALAPQNAEYHVHRGHLLYRGGDIGAAAASFDHAAGLDPANREAWRAQLVLYRDSGRLSEAVAAGGTLLRHSPDDAQDRECVLELLRHRSERVDDERVLPGAGEIRVWRPLPQPRLADAWRTQRRVVRALIIRETRTRFGDSRLGYGWALIEPVLHVVTLSLAFAALMHGRPPIGQQFFIFYYTGLIPYHLFVHTSSSMAYAIAANGALLQLPPVRIFDVILARGLLEIVTDLVVATLVLGAFNAIGIAALPHDGWEIASALVVTAALGCGCGFVNAVLTTMFRSWDKMWVQVTRALYFCSGVFYVPAMMPDWVRHILVWNPMLHAVDWFRAGFFADYRPHWLDRGYLALVAIVLVLAGLGLERGLRRKLGEPL
jgi:capsular polysaccharide transport system permease protein